MQIIILCDISCEICRQRITDFAGKRSFRSVARTAAELSAQRGELFALLLKGVFLRNMLLFKRVTRTGMPIAAVNAYRPSSLRMLGKCDVAHRLLFSLVQKLFNGGRPSGRRWVGKP
jgi:hypothetical protein